MKKCLSIICVVAMLLTFMVPVSAADALTLSVGSATAKAGDTVYVPVIIDGIEKSETEAINQLDYTVSFDTTKLTFNAVTKYAAAKEPWKTWKNLEGFSRGLITLSFTAPQLSADNKLNFVHVAADADGDNGYLAAISLTVKSDTPAGVYPINLVVNKCKYQDQEMAESGTAAIELPVVAVSGSITVEGSEPTPVAKTVTYTAVNGTVMASTVALAAPAEAKASGTIKTAGTAPEEEVYFYFFPNKGYTTDGMTVNGAEVIGAAASKKYTVTADATYDFVFKKIEDAAAITAKPTGAISGTPAAASLTTFATAAGASEFGILIGAADAWGTDITADYAAASETGKIRKYAALEANGEGQFAIELNDTAKNFLKNGTYRAYIYAANGSIVTFGDAIDIAIAE